MNDIKRDRLDIMLNILDIAREPVKKTHILYRANINHAQLMKHLNTLEKLGMIIEYEPNKYTITDKGRIFLSLLLGKEEVLLKH